MTLNHTDVVALRAEQDARITEWSATDMSLVRMGCELGISLSAVRKVRKRLGLASRGNPEFNPDRDARVAEMSAAGLTMLEMARDLGISDCAVGRIRKRLGLPLRPSPIRRRAKLTGPYTLGDALRANLAPRDVPQPSKVPQRRATLHFNAGHHRPPAVVALPDGTLPEIIRFRDRLFVQGRGTDYHEGKIWPVFDELDLVDA